MLKSSIKAVLVIGLCLATTAFAGDRHSGCVLRHLPPPVQAETMASFGLRAGDVLQMHAVTGVSLAVVRETSPLVFKVDAPAKMAGCVVIGTAQVNAVARISVRGESIYCDTADRGHQSERIQGFAVGSDGKEGLVGTIQSRQVLDRDLVTAELEAGASASLVLMHDSATSSTPSILGY